MYMVHVSSAALVQCRNADTDTLEAWNHCQAWLFSQAMQATPLQAHLLTDVWSCLIRYILYRALARCAAACPSFKRWCCVSYDIASDLACIAA